LLLPSLVVAAVRADILLNLYKHIEQLDTSNIVLKPSLQYHNISQNQ
jgi:hypothetical protein